MGSFLNDDCLCLEGHGTVRNRHRPMGNQDSGSTPCRSFLTAHGGGGGGGCYDGNRLYFDFFLRLQQLRAVVLRKVA